MKIRTVRQLPPLPRRPREGHKGLFGRVLVVGGGPTMIGAPILAGTAALRCGAGLVQVAMPGSVLATALAITPELIGLPLSETIAPATRNSQLATLSDAAQRADALVIGPGMGTSRAARAHLKLLLDQYKPAVLDADALNLLAAEKRWPDMKLLAVLTPHPGEMTRLGRFINLDRTPDDDAGRGTAALAFAIHTRQVVLLKGHRTVVSDGSRIYVNRSGDSTLSKAGAGDILSGIIGCLLAQGMGPFDAACLGAWLHGKAGQLAGRIFGRRSALAGDVILALCDVLRSADRR